MTHTHTHTRKQAMTQLSEAAKSGDMAYVSKVLQGLKEMRKTVLNTSKDREGFLLLHIASYFGHLQLARSLLTMGSRVDLVSDGSFPRSCFEKFMFVGVCKWDFLFLFWIKSKLMFVSVF